jgi:prolyl-tRNA editing enzyme YbaK/EbsC (Cys-tRNA(Pro) deacylase)
MNRSSRGKKQIKHRNLKKKQGFEQKNKVTFFFFFLLFYGSAFAMLEYFLESKKINAELKELTEEPSLNAICRKTGLEKEAIFKTKVFFDENKDVWICVYPWGKNIKPEKITEKVPEFHSFVSGKELEDAIGYKENLVPPLSVYEAKTLIDETFRKQEKIAGICGEENTLLVVFVESLLEELGENAIFAPFT